MECLSDLRPGEWSVIRDLQAGGSLRKRLLAMGLTPGARVLLGRVAPLGDPLLLQVRGYGLSIRRAEACLIAVDRLPPPPTEKAALPLRPATVRKRADISDIVSTRSSSLRIALAGNPNCGKTTLFNALTGSRQYVGNWPGVTVEKKSAPIKGRGSAPIKGDGSPHTKRNSELVDLPGLYSLESYSMEERVALGYLKGRGEDSPDAILNIVDGTNLERNLYLTLQLLELGLPMVVAVNMIDEVEKNGHRLDCARLSSLLGVPVIPVAARAGRNLGRLLATVERVAVEGSISAGPAISSSLIDEPEQSANERYRLITRLVEECLQNSHKKAFAGHSGRTGRIDAFFLGKLTAFPAFALLLGGMFALTFGPLGRFFSGLVERFCSGVISPLLRLMLEAGSAPEWCRRLLLEGVLGGVSGVLVFLPQIALLFLCLSLLEDSGYMARAAFLMDRPLRAIGLTGKAFIPMLMGFGCTTPAVMAARGLENERERRMTIMLTPFMSCGARLPIYAMFAGVFFAEWQGPLVLGLYLLGILAAIGVGALLRRSAFRAEASPFVLELPPYRLPKGSAVLRHVWEKAKGFLFKAGTLILAMSVLLWAAQTVAPGFRPAATPEDSLLGLLGQACAPLLHPLGFGVWQAAVALLTGLIAKESVVSSLTILYAGGAAALLPGALAVAFTPASALSFMVFSLLYMPCISAFATIVREMNSVKWGLATAALQGATAYLISFLVYRAALLLGGI